MKIPASALEAFLAVARVGRFAKAASQLGISQGALSQRILNLESQLESTLFVRSRAGTRLTPEGEELLRYATAQESLEEEFLEARRSGGSGLKGSLRVAGFSSVTRSILLPALANLARSASLRLSIFSRELAELPGLLRSGEADIVVSDAKIESGGVSSLQLGFEENVLVRSRRWKNGSERYLDHDSDDLTTQRYLRKFGAREGSRLERLFLDEVYGLLDGVKLGLGEAVLPVHLVQEDKEIEIISPGKVLRVPVWLHFPAQGYYPKLHVKAREEIVAFAKAKLAQK